MDSNIFSPLLSLSIHPFHQLLKTSSTPPIKNGARILDIISTAAPTTSLERSFKLPYPYDQIPSFSLSL